MENLTESFGQLYNPLKALVIFKRTGTDTDYYIESYDMDNEGRPINGHPLTVRESGTLAKALVVNQRKAQGFLIPKGIMPSNILHINSNMDGCAIWYTPRQTRRLLFSQSLGIPSGAADIPAMVWKASKRRLQVFAVQDEQVTIETTLQRAPFFNVYQDGAVCMGNVDVSIPSECGLEQFMKQWEDYFFNSFFSHTMNGEGVVKGNIIQLWQHLIATKEPFPADKLLSLKIQFKNLIQ